MSTLRAALHLAAKDLRLYVRDKGGLALGFLLPIALISVMAAVFAPARLRGEGLGPTCVEAGAREAREAREARASAREARARAEGGRAKARGSEARDE